MNIKTRFAPSSTGFLHIGGMRTALYSWLFAKKNNGSFVLRIEDTDFKRSNSIFIKNILKTLEWLEISWDEGPYLQSDRLLLYKNKIHEMLELGLAYKCYCSIHRLKKIRLQQLLNGEKPKYDYKCRNKKYNMNYNKKYVVRFKNPRTGKVFFKDQIRGDVVFQNSELDDMIIQRQNGIPTYNFCVVIDDLSMNITHVIRGEDHINNTPRQINILQSLKSFIPTYAHVSMVVDNNKDNLSKRNNALSILGYKKEGFLKESILNYLIKLGWSYNNQEIFSMGEMKKLFSIHAVSKSSSELNFKKLLWFNNYYLNKLPINNYLINNFKKQLFISNVQYNNNINFYKIIKILRNRCNTLQDMVNQSFYFFKKIKHLNLFLISKYSFLNCNKILHIVYKNFCIIKKWNSVYILQILKKISYKYNIFLKNIFMLLRIAITGIDKTPSINSIISIIGKNKTLYSIKNILHHLKMI